MPISTRIPAVTLVLTLAVRSLYLILIIASLDHVFDLGTAPEAIIVLGIIGIVLGQWLTRKNFTTRGMIVSWGLLYLLYSGIFELLFEFFPRGESATFQLYIVQQHLNIALLSFMLCFLSSWCFFRYRSTLTVEVLLLGGLVVALLSGHRNYRLDSPQVINTFAWDFGVNPPTILVGIGVLTLIILLIYRLAGVLIPLRGEHRSVITSRRGTIASAIALTFVIFTVIGIGRAIYAGYSVERGLTTNGVGENKEAGQSPLGFHSALGSTNQPAALVRLEGDYPRNPFSPMLYMREGALSGFNGHEMVLAESSYDTDAPRTSPSQPYVGTEDPDLSPRIEVAQSVYMLSDQKNAFAIDYPLSIRQLKNPDPTKFRATFRAYSIAPTYTLDEIKYDPIGDPRWSKEVEAHYLKTHEDPRYQKLALELTKSVASPVEKAFAIIAYLSKNSIYTLTPNHSVDPREDQTAPYLFGDMRGYCVHFAHAMVYMFRSLGIPSRIGTGYLTDLSQSKDGHILLRMSDRHAWAEIYIEKRGWVPFDIQPEQVENAADTNIDMKLLEELMGKLDPGEEILPKELTKDEAGVEERPWVTLPDRQTIFICIGVLLSLLALLKLHIRFGWAFTKNPERRLLRSYRAIQSLLIDLGSLRAEGETRNEFAKRVIRQANPRLHQYLEQRIYRGVETDLSLIDSARIADIQALGQLSIWRKAWAFCNPSSLYTIYGGGRW